MASHLKRYYTPEEYLAMERRAEHKSEYLAGQIIAMAGASRAHNLIVTNVAASLTIQLENRECEVYSSDMRVRTPDTNLYTYPDVAVVCGEPQFEDSAVDTLLNPTLIVEALSPSTETKDRTTKFADYRKIVSLVEYILIAQDECRLTQYIRQPRRLWLFNEVTDIEESVRLTSIDCTLSLKAVYRKVKFAPAMSEEQNPA